MKQHLPITDRRVARTRLALRNAFLSLLGEMAWDDISVQAICEGADVGRSTFYLHFQSKESLLVASLADLRDQLLAPQASEIRSFSFLPGLLAHMADNHRVFERVVGRRGGQAVVVRFKAMICQLVEAELNHAALGAEPPPWLANFLAGGIVETMGWWIDAHESVEIEVLAETLQIFCNKSVQNSIDK